MRFTSCSDGLTKSSMAVSLEQVRLVMGEHEVERETSCRLLDTPVTSQEAASAIACSLL